MSETRTYASEELDFGTSAGERADEVHETAAPTGYELQTLRALRTGGDA